MPREGGWLGRRQALARERATRSVDEWLQKSLQAYEQVTRVDDVPAAAHAIESPDWKWSWAPFIPFLLSLWVRGSAKVSLLIFAGLVAVASATRTKGYYVAVTDRRVLFQRLKHERGKPVGPAVAYPPRNLSVLRFTPAKGQSWYSTLVLSMQEPAGPHKITLGFHKLVWQKNAEAIKKALERQGPNLGPEQVWSLPPGRP
jgi:hypothetical protein